MACLICGDLRTVESHIVPRAFYRDIAGDEQHGYEASAYTPGVKYQAKGLFDKTILCRLHEDKLNACDAYGIEFVRTFHDNGRPILQGNMWEVPNPRPDLLVRFIAACIWRRGVSHVKREHGNLTLGLAEPRLRRFLFEDCKSYDPPLIVARKIIVSQGEPLHELMFEPAKGYGFGDNTWSFHLFGVEFTMKLNPYSVPPFPAVAIANKANPLWAWNFEPTEISEIENAMSIAVNMFLDRKTSKPRDNPKRRRPSA